MKNKSRLLPVAWIVATLFLALAGGYRLYLEYQRLLFGKDFSAAIDLSKRYHEAETWFSGAQLYTGSNSAYPPATYAMLWPLLGWVSFDTARWIWAATATIALVTLCVMCVRYSRAEKKSEMFFAGLIPLAMNATGITIGNGQLILHILPLLLGGLLVLRGDGISSGRVIAGSCLILFALVQPTIGAPFLWLVLIFSPLALTVIATGYLALSAIAISFQPQDAWTLLELWRRGSFIDPETIERGYANLHTWLFYAAAPEWMLPASIALFVMLGAWTWRHRATDLWVLIGVTSIVARFWAYHRMYDDLVVLPAIIATFRMYKSDDIPNGSRRFALILIAFAVVAGLARLSNISPARQTILTSVNAIVWSAMLGFLIYRSHSARLALSRRIPT